MLDGGAPAKPGVEHVIAPAVAARGVASMEGCRVDHGEHSRFENRFPRTVEKTGRASGYRTYTESVVQVRFEIPVAAAGCPAFKERKTAVQKKTLAAALHVRLWQFRIFFHGFSVFQLFDQNGFIVWLAAKHP